MCACMCVRVCVLVQALVNFSMCTVFAYGLYFRCLERVVKKSFVRTMLTVVGPPGPAQSHLLMCADGSCLPPLMTRRWQCYFVRVPDLAWACTGPWMRSCPSRHLGNLDACWSCCHCCCGGRCSHRHMYMWSLDKSTHLTPIVKIHASNIPAVMCEPHMFLVTSSCRLPGSICSSILVESLPWLRVVSRLHTVLI